MLSSRARLLAVSVSRPQSRPASSHLRLPTVRAHKPATTRQRLEKNAVLVPHLDFSKHLHILFQARTRWIVTELAQGCVLPEPLLAKLFAVRGIPLETAKAWTSILADRNLYDALDRLGLLESAGDARPHDIPCPDWLFLALPALLTRPEDANYLAGMLISQKFAALPLPDQGLFIARSIQFFIRCRHLVAARETVEWLCFHRTDIVQSRTFARCLEALTRDHSKPGSATAPPPEFLHSLASRLTTAMRERNVAPTLDTFWPLFSPSLIPQDTSGAFSLLNDMVRAQIKPPKDALYMVMKVYAANAESDGAELLRERIMIIDEKERAEAKGKGEGKDQEVGGSEAGSLEQANSSEFESELERAAKAMRGLASDDLDERPFYADLETTYLRSLAEDPHEALEQFKVLHARNAASERPVDISASWAVLLQILARSDQISSEELLVALNTLESAHSHDSRETACPNVHHYSIVLHGLSRRREHGQAIALWRRICWKGVRPDATLLSTAVSAYIGHGDLDLAERTLEQCAFRPPVPTTPWREKPHRGFVRLDVVPYNALMVAYSRAGRYRAAYGLFSSLARYGVRANHATLSILLNTARFASAAAGKGYGPGDEALSSSSSGEDVDDIWDGKEAWRLAESLMWSILESNYPDVADHLDDDSCGGGVGAFRQLANRLFLPSSSREGSGTGRRRPFSTTLAPDAPAYPHLHPTLGVFRAFIQLLGYHSTGALIPRALAWMRFLGVRPDRDTLVLAVMYVDEGAPGDGKRARLKKWIEEWLGKGEAPSEEELADRRRGARRM